jgi:hypothetical protein
MAEIGNKFGLGGGGGVHFKEPWLLKPYTAVATTLQIYENTTARTSSAAAFFTEMANRGLQDQTNWTANTYKTILNVASGKGLVAAYVGPTAGGASTHTVEFTVDGVLTEVTIPDLASGERGLLLACPPMPSDTFTTAAVALQPNTEVLDANKRVFGVIPGTPYLPPWWLLGALGVPLLRFNTSLLIRAKHSADITNSTATAYSGVQYTLGS